MNVLQFPAPVRRTRSSSEIEAELMRLHLLLNRTPALTGFGDSNIDALLAQMEVLESRLTVEDVYNMEDDEDWPVYTTSAALTALEWRDDDGEAPSMGWLQMLKDDIMDVRVN